MARLRATASAARSVLDGREHDGMLDRVGAAISDNQTIKSSPQKAIKKRADAYLRCHVPARRVGRLLRADHEVVVRGGDFARMAVRLFLTVHAATAATATAANHV